MKIALVTNLATHYRRPLFEELGRRCPVDFFFTSRGAEQYWLPEHELSTAGLEVRGNRPRDLIRLLRGDYRCIVATLTGRRALPFAFLAARLRRVPFVVWVGIWEHPRTPFHRISRPFARMIYRRADVVLVYGTHVARYIEAEAGRVENVIVVPQAVDNVRFRTPPSTDRVTACRSAMATGKHVALYVGRLEDEKGLEYLLEALASTPEWCLALVGTGSLRGGLEQMVLELGLEERVRFFGYATQDRVPEYLYAAEALVLPSVATATFREPWGLVVNEAMNARLPVIATDAVGAAAGGLVQHGRTGFVVPQRDAHGLADALRELEDEGLRSQFGAAGRERVKEWSYDAAADAIVNAVEQAVAA